MSDISKTADSRNSLQFHPLADIFPLMEGAEFDELRAKLEAAGASQQRPSTNGKGKEENGAGGNDALASAGKRKAAYALDAGSDPGPIPECLRRDRVS